MRRAALFAVAAALLSAACSSQPSEGRGVLNYLTEVLAEPPGEDCEYGGERLRLGVDENRDGRLDDREVRASGVACRQLVEDGPDMSPDQAPGECTLTGGDGAMLSSTGAAADLALAGAGFFVLKSSGSAGPLYTRVGSFHFGEDACLLNAQGLRLQGYPVDVEGGGELADLCGGALELPPKPTTRALLACNVDSNSQNPADWDPAAPASTSNFSVSVDVFDQLGAGHMITVYFARATLGSWRWHATVDGSEVEGGVADRPYEGAAGILAFTPDGALDDDSTSFSSWPFPGSDPQTIAFDFGTSISSDGGTGLDGTTHFASPSSNNGVSTDGYAAGALSALAVDEAGAVAVTYTNGETRPFGRAAIALFTSTEGLACAGSELWEATDASGEPLLATAGQAGRGRVVSGSIERPIL